MTMTYDYASEKGVFVTWLVTYKCIFTHYNLSLTMELLQVQILVF